MATVMERLERVPVDAISERAEQIDFGRTVLKLIGGLLFCLGWVVARTVQVVWRAFRWCAAAFMVGWAEARKPQELTVGSARPH